VNGQVTVDYHTRGRASERVRKAMFISKLNTTVVLFITFALTRAATSLGSEMQQAEPMKEQAASSKSGDAKGAELKDGKNDAVSLEEPVQAMRWSRDAKAMASLSVRVKHEGGKKIRLGTVRIWDARTGKMILSLGELEYPGPPSLMMFDFTPDGKMLAISQRLRPEVGDKVELYDIETGALVQTIEADYGRSRVWFAFAPDGGAVALCGSDIKDGNLVSTLRLYDVKTGKLKRTLVANDVSGSLISVTYSADGKLLAGGGYGGAIVIWDLTTGKITRTLHSSRDLEDGDGAVAALAFSPDGKMVASGGGAAKTTVWDMATGKARLLKGPQDESRIQKLAFSPDSRYLVGEVRVARAGKNYHNVRIWDVRTGELLKENEGLLPAREFVNWAPGFTITPDGKRLAVLYDEKTVKFSDVVQAAEPGR
jgi:WD40 repeat protein